MEDTFLKELHHEISNSQARLKHIKLWNNLLKISAIALTFFITIILGWKFNNPSDLTVELTRNIATTLGALATLVTALTKFWNTEKKLIKEDFREKRLTTIRTKYLIIKNEIEIRDKVSILKNDFFEVLEDRARKNPHQ